jgi:hypothetical protein
MWPETTHDFGTVPRGAQLLYRIPWKNPEQEPVSIIDLRASCNCATVTAHPLTLKPGETGYLEVAMDGRRFNGLKKIYVQLVTSPGPKGMTLEVTANSRQDLVYNPGQIKFGVLPVGTAVTQTVEIDYAGVLAWRILDVEKAPDHMDVRFEETSRKPGENGQPGTVGYKVTATLKDTAPSGDLKQQIILRTNDPAEPTIAVVVEATIRAAVAITPNPVNFGTTKVGKAISRRCTIRTDKPFKVTRIEGGADVAAVFTPSDNNVQRIELQWTPTAPGEMQQEIKIFTDLAEASEMKVTLTGTAK